MIATMIQRIGTIYSTMSATSTIMPTETKKMAPKRSFTGATRCSICSASTVSARILPMMKAPNAAENPTEDAITTMPKHKARAVISMVSLLINDFTLRRNSGMRKMPTTNQRTRKNMSFRMDMSICVPSNSLLTANVESITMSTMAKMSSMMSTLNTSLAKRFSRSPISSKALKMMVVEDMASIPPR